MAQFRRRDNGALIEAEQLDHDETTKSPLFRDLYTSDGRRVVDSMGIPMRVQDGTVDVTTRAGEWKVTEGVHTWPLPDGVFQQFAIDAGDHEFTPYSMQDAQHYAVVNRETEEAIRSGQRLPEMHGDNQDPDDVQRHNLEFYRAQAWDERADMLERLRGAKG